MSAKTIKSALGLLQDDPDSTEAWQELLHQVEGPHGMGPEELAALLEAARRAYETRREYEAVGKLLEIELVAARGTPREPVLLAELARILDEELLDDAAARAAYERLLALKPDDEAAAEALERSAAKRAKWRDLLERYVQEAHSGDRRPVPELAPRDGAAEVVFRYGREGGEGEPLERIVGLLREALAIDAKSRRAEMLLERVLPRGRPVGRRRPGARALRERGDAEGTRRSRGGWRLARAFAKKLGKSPDAARRPRTSASSTWRPGRPEALGASCPDYFTTREMWDHLVALYEGQLSAGAFRSKEEEFGATLQVAMVHFRMRGKPDAAEPWFERLRKLEPANAGMLTFFREWCSLRGARPRGSRRSWATPSARRRTGPSAPRSSPRSPSSPRRARTRRRRSSSGGACCGKIRGTATRATP